MTRRNSCLLDHLKCGNCKQFYADCSRAGQNSDGIICDDFVPISRMFYDDSETPKFIPLKLADYISYHMNEHYMTPRDTGRIHRWDHNKYVNDGKSYIHEYVQAFINDGVSKRRTDEVIHCLKTNTYISRQKHSLPLELVPLNNGLLNLKTKELEPHDPQYFYTNTLNVEYKKDAECKTFFKFLSEVVAKEDIPIIQELLGYLLIKDYRFQYAFCFLGEGANGKSTLLNTIIEMLGKDNISSLSLHELVVNRFAPSRLYGKYANIHPDLSSKALRDTAMFKMLTGGDAISADKKFKDGFEFFNYAKLIWSANRLPKINQDDTIAFFRRWILITFPHSFTKNADHNLINKLTTKKELSGILNWAIEGYERLIEKDKFSYSVTTEKVEEQYLKMSDPIKAFVLERIAPRDLSVEEMEESEYVLRFTNSGFILKEDLYQAYLQYCSDKRLPAAANNVFARDLLRAAQGIKGGLFTVFGKRQRVWEGIEYIGKTYDNPKEAEEEGNKTLDCFGGEDEGEN